MGEAGAVMPVGPLHDPTYEERIAELSAGDTLLDLRDPRPLKLTVDDLILLDRHWQDDDRKSTELIDGRIYTTPVRYMPRGTIAQEIWFQLRELAASSAPHLRTFMRGSVEISRFDLPLPDVVLTSEPNGDGFIPAASVPLIVEVADTALDFYMGNKLTLYARSGIPEYWVVNVNGRVIYQMWAPNMNIYTEQKEVTFGALLSAAYIQNLIISTTTL